MTRRERNADGRPGPPAGLCASLCPRVLVVGQGEALTSAARRRTPKDRACGRSEHVSVFQCRCLLRICQRLAARSWLLGAGCRLVAVPNIPWACTRGAVRWRAARATVAAPGGVARTTGGSGSAPRVAPRGAYHRTGSNYTVTRGEIQPLYCRAARTYATSWRRKS